VAHLPALHEMELAYPWLQIIPAVSDEPAHDHDIMYGTIPELAAKATWDERDVYISGPDHMIVKTARVLRERGARIASSTTTWTLKTRGRRKTRRRASPSSPAEPCLSQNPACLRTLLISELC
jgi:NAD(P)H-flavin reductase